MISLVWGKNDTKKIMIVVIKKNTLPTMFLDAYASQGSTLSHTESLTDKQRWAFCSEKGRGRVVRVLKSEQAELGVPHSEIQVELE